MADYRIQKLDFKKLGGRLADALAAMKGDDSFGGAQRILAILGYESERTLPHQSGEPAEFLEQFPPSKPSRTKSEQAFCAAIRSIRLLFQFGEEELRGGKVCFFIGWRQRRFSKEPA